MIGRTWGTTNGPGGPIMGLGELLDGPIVSFICSMFVAAPSKTHKEHVLVE